MSKQNLKLSALAAKANQLALDLEYKSEVRRIADRLARNPNDAAGAYAAVVYELTVNGSLAPCLLHCEAFVLRNVALLETSRALWERMCRDRGLDLEKENPELESIWREEVRVMITESGEDWLLDCELDEYKACLLENDADPDIAEELVDWITAVRS